MNSNHYNILFNREIARCKECLQGKLFGACGSTTEVLIDRIMQKLVEIGLKPFLAFTNNLNITSHEGLEFRHIQLNCGRAYIEVGSGKITIGPQQWLANQWDFFLHWVYCFIAILDVTSAVKSDVPATLIFGVGEESLFKDESDAEFVNYCRLGPIEPLNKGQRFLIQSASAKVSSCQSRFEYCKKPLIRLLRESRLGALGRLKLIANHVALFFAYVASSIRLSELSLLGQDFAYASVAFEMDNRGLIDSVVLTTANFPIQPLWIRALARGKAHMVWYSQAAKQIIYSADELDGAVPSYPWIRVNTHWVWTHSFAKYLNSLCHEESIKVVGPIVWSIPTSSSPKEDAIEIVVFDISPYDDEIALSCGEFPNYNNPNNLTKFIVDIISLKAELAKVLELPIILKLKTKRGYRSAYDRDYFDFLEKMDVSGEISIIHHATNLYSLISGSHLAIAYPFTSPPYLAEFLRVPSIYYDPTKSIVRDHFGDSSSLIDFANSPTTLLDASISALREVFLKGNTEKVLSENDFPNTA